MKKLHLSILFVFFLAFVQAQSYTIDPDNPVKVSVKGNSTLHEWEAVASDVTGYPTEFTVDLGGISLKTFGFKVGVESLDGGRGASMNKKIKKALLSTEHPYIIFTSAEMVGIPSDIKDSNEVKNTGVLQIAGEKMDIEVMGLAKLTDGVLVLSGSKDLKMSDFNIEPPTAMFGQIKTRDDITVHFEFRYVANE